MENQLKYYKRLQYTGNENGWHEPIITLGHTTMNDQQADELNSHFRNTGIKYEVTTKAEAEKTKVTTDQADHGEPNLSVKDGKFAPTNSKNADKIKQQLKDTPIVEQKPASDAKPTDDDAFLKSDATVHHAEKKDNGNKQPAIQTTAGN